MTTTRFSIAALIAALIGLIATQLLYRPGQIQPLQRDPRIPVFHRMETDRPPPIKDKSYEGDNDPTRNRLRREALLAAIDLADDLCSTAAKQRYVEAASKYVRARYYAAPCVVSRTCSSKDMGSIEQAGRDFGTELDDRLREKMEYIHTRGGAKATDFPPDLVQEVRGIVRTSDEDDTARREWCAKNSGN